MALRSKGAKLRPSGAAKLRLPPKVADAELLTPAHQAFRDIVLARAGYRCEWIERGIRCPKAAPLHRMIADHVVERKDGGAPFDPRNGQCLCVEHNTLKGVRSRKSRHGRRG